jgi:hypothetical protein
MRALLFFLLLIPFAGLAQKEQPALLFGRQENNFSAIKSFKFPTICGDPSAFPFQAGADTSRAALAFDSCNNRLWIYNPANNLWDTIKVGNQDFETLQEIFDKEGGVAQLTKNDVIKLPPHGGIFNIHGGNGTIGYEIDTAFVSIQTEDTVRMGYENRSATVIGHTTIMDTALIITRGNGPLLISKYLTMRDSTRMYSLGGDFSYGVKAYRHLSRVPTKTTRSVLMGGTVYFDANPGLISWNYFSRPQGHSASMYYRGWFSGISSYFINPYADTVENFIGFHNNTYMPAGGHVKKYYEFYGGTAGNAPWAARFDSVWFAYSPFARSKSMFAGPVSFGSTTNSGPTESVEVIGNIKHYNLQWRGAPASEWMVTYDTLTKLYSRQPVPIVGGGGSTITNIGTGISIGVDLTNNMKKVAPGFGQLIDSITTANTVTFSPDSATWVTKATQQIITGHKNFNGGLTTFSSPNGAYRYTIVGDNGGYIIHDYNLDPIFRRSGTNVFTYSANLWQTNSGINFQADGGTLYVNGTTDRVSIKAGTAPTHDLTVNGSVRLTVINNGAQTDSVLVKNGGEIKAIAPMSATSDGTYTPTLTNTTNITSSTANVTGYYRVGNRVTVYGTVSVTPTTELLYCELQMSLPVASNFAQTFQLGGSGALKDYKAAVSIDASVANDRAVLGFITPFDSASGIITFQFSYSVI